MIVPLSCISDRSHEDAGGVFGLPLRLGRIVSLYSARRPPVRSFPGRGNLRLAILLQRMSANPPYLFTSHFQRWLPEGRQNLFSLVSYSEVQARTRRLDLIPKIASALHASVLAKLCSAPRTIGDFVVPSAKHEVYCHRIVAHFVKAMDFIPFFKNERDGVKKSEDYKVFAVGTAASKTCLTSVLNSGLFYCWFVSLL